MEKDGLPYKVLLIMSNEPGQPQLISIKSVHVAIFATEHNLTN